MDLHEKDSDFVFVFSLRSRTSSAAIADLYTLNIDAEMFFGGFRCTLFDISTVERRTALTSTERKKERILIDFKAR